METYRLYLLLISMIVGALAFTLVARNLRDFNAADVGLGIATTTHDAFLRDLQVSQSHGNYHEIAAAIDTFHRQGFSLGMFIGNSQLHSVNYFAPGDQLAVTHANERAEKRAGPIRYIQLSSPNINLQEALIYYLAMLQENRRPDWLILGLPYRSFQLNGIRERFVNNLQNLPLDKFQLSPAILKEYQSISTVDKRDFQEATDTPQDELEEYLVDRIENNWEAYRYRGNVRSKLKLLPGLWYQKLLVSNYQLKGPESTVEKNLLYLEQLLVLANQQGSKVLIYQPPHPQTDSKLQYDMEAYHRFFQKLKSIAEQSSHVYYKNLEALVPVEYWGLNNRGWLDIFHFRADGHQLLGKELDRSLQKIQEAK